MLTKRQFWTAERDEQLEELHSQKIPFSKIAKIMGTTKNSVIGRAHRLGLEKRRSGFQPKEKREYHPMPLPENVIPMVRVDLEEPEAIGPLNDFPKDNQRTCRFIHGDIREGNWRCCGQLGYPYCGFHHAKCRVPNTRSPQRDQSFLAKKLA